MQTVTIELINEKALKLLQQLEQLNILRLITDKNEKTSKPARNWSGSITKETGEKMLQYVDKDRKE